MDVSSLSSKKEGAWNANKGTFKPFSLMIESKGQVQASKVIQILNLGSLKQVSIEVAPPNESKEN